jgi:hypothetical protein
MHKSLSLSISPLMSTLTTPNAQNLNFRFNIKWSTHEWPKTHELARKWQMKRKRKTQHSLEHSQWNLSPFCRIYHIFHKLLSTRRLAKEFYHFVHILSPFVNELIKHKPREVDAKHEIKIRVLHKLYQQIFKATMLKNVSRLCKNESYSSQLDH